MVSREISHYRIIRKLGAGGMGEVHLAEDIKLERKVAIKMLPARLTGDEQAKKRLLREARAAATLDHPNICAIHEVGEEGDFAFIVMQYVEGHTIAERIKNGPLDVADIVDIGIKVATALAEAHSHGIIHRDIKPQNIIVTSRNQVKVLDFGVAKSVADEPAVDSLIESRITDTGQVMGTVGYMSPEQLRGQRLDGRTDLFSLGVTLYECATGKPAFSGTSAVDISVQIVQVDPVKASLVNPELPEELDDIIEKAVAKDASDRYQSAEAMLADLNRLRDSLMTETSSRTLPITVPPAPSTFTWSQRARRLLNNSRARLALLLMPLVILTGIWFALRQPGPQQPSPEAIHWYDRGTEMIHAGTYYQASKALELAVRLDPKFVLAHARLAEAYMEMDNHERAMEELLQAMSLVPDRSALTTVDALYFDAIGSTVRRDFSNAIDYYSKIVAEAPEPQKAKALVELGRSYERDENLSRAVECYLEATRRDSQSAAAMLRLAILYGRRQELSNANQAFDRAESLYEPMTNLEGQTEVLYQRGTMLSKIRKLAEAKAQLERALQISRSLESKYQYIKTQLQLSSIFFAEGNTEQAKGIALEAIALAQANNIRNLATNGLIDLGYTLVSRGELSQATNYFTQALSLARDDKARRTEARAKMALGSVIVQQGNPDEAIPLLEQALGFYQPAGYRKEASIALVLLGRAHRNKGNYEVALKTFEQQLELAKELDDPAQIVASHSSIAILLGAELEKYSEALAHLDESYRINEQIGAKIGMGYDQMNRGTFLWQLGRYNEARTALDMAFSIANRPEASYKAVLAWVHLTNAQMALSERRFSDAIAKGRQALQLAGAEYGDVALQAKQTLGLAQAHSGSTQSGRKLCDEAVATAREVNSPRLLSSALLALSEAMLLGNDATGASTTALQVQPMFARAGQQDSEWRAWLIAARASKLAGDTSAMKDFASRAETLCAGLERKWGAEAYQGYLLRPDIQAYRNELSRIIASSK